ncbi:MAG: tetratricopeptide repeat protein [Bacteroidales bacterium]|jgi:hypothetical protein
MLKNLSTYIQKPERLDQESLKGLNETIEKYPFFQTARLLHIKNVQNVNSKVDENELHLTATYVSDRKILYYLLHKFPVPAKKTERKNIYGAGNHVEKEIKDTLKENISSTLNEQLNIYDTIPEAEIELIPGLAIDVRKEYGAGIELDDKTYSLNNPPKQSFSDGNEIFELDVRTGETETEDLTDSEIVTESIPADSELIEISRESSVDLEQKTDERPSASPSESSRESTDPSAATGSYPFTSWLEAIDKRLSLINEDDREEDIKTGTSQAEPSQDKIRKHDKESNGTLIDKFIESNPKIVPRKENAANDDISENSVKEHESFFTDTLAQIYIKQGHYAKAIFAYEKLSLKYPEKSAYFAGQISEIKKLIKNS